MNGNKSYSFGHCMVNISNPFYLSGSLDSIQMRIARMILVLLDIEHNYLLNINLQRDELIFRFYSFSLNLYLC